MLDRPFVVELSDKNVTGSHSSLTASIALHDICGCSELLHGEVGGGRESCDSKELDKQFLSICLQTTVQDLVIQDLVYHSPFYTPRYENICQPSVASFVKAIDVPNSDPQYTISAKSY